MVFWTITALLVLAAVFSVVLPFLRSSGSAGPREAHDIEVYRDQLDELERDVKRGHIAPDEAAEARAEIGRRILRVEDALKGEATTRLREGSVRLAVIAAVLAVPVVSWGVYGAIGSPGTPDEPLQARLSKDPSNSTIEELIARAEAHLADNPDDARGWEVLAPVYFRLGRYADARTAYENAIRIDGSTAARQADLGEAIAGEAGGVITAEAEKAFKAALTRDKDNAKARFFLAMARAQEGQLDEARRMWADLHNALPPDSPWQGAIEEAMAQAQGKPAPSGKTADAGPTTADVAAASQMKPEGRAAMVEGMVARLDARLRKNPDDPDGWRRLVRSYTVLGRMDDAENALERGVAALGDDTDAARKLQTFAARLGVSVVE